MEDIRSLEGVGYDELFEVRNEAFRGYPVSWTKEAFIKMITRRGYVPALSFGAFDGQRLVSFTLNCIGTYNGKRTIYDTSTGTIEEYRGKGLASRIFEASRPALKTAGAEQYLLEVMTDNTKAISVYKNMGFVVSREFNYFVQGMEQIKIKKQTPVDIILRGTTLSDKAIMQAMWDFAQSWQNTFDALEKNIENFKIIGAFSGDRLLGYGIIEPSSGDIPQLAVDKNYRRKGIGSAILKELLSHNNYTSVKVINTDASIISIASFLEQNGIGKCGMQYEMIKSL
ncbi:MAG: GCN5-Related N-Acetyltransferase [Flavipsychrobacter sp.]|nr:GCN5-Related N-Acetyltransferase [Flavipsychrobacter sp.]